MYAEKLHEERILDRLYPRIEVSAEIKEENDEDFYDRLLAEGMRQASAIVAQGSLHGRRRIHGSATRIQKEKSS